MKAVKAYWTFAKAAKLLDEEHSCCKLAKSERLIPMMPKYIGNWRKGMKEILELDVGRYTEWVEGVLLGYNNIKVSQTSLPLDDQPSMHFAVHMDAIVFQPTIGSTLKCTVNEVAPDHIGCLAHNFFNVSIPLNKILKRNGRLTALRQGTQLLVEVNKIQSMHGIISIQGKLPKDFSNTLKNLSMQAQADSDSEVPMDTTMSDDSLASVSIVPSSQKRRSDPVPVDIVSSSELDSSLNASTPDKVKKKKKKKRKHLESGTDAESPMKIDLFDAGNADDTNGQDDLDSSLDVKSPEGISHPKSSKKDKKKKKKLSADVDTPEQHNVSKMPKKEQFTELRLDDSTSDLSFSDSSLKSSKKKKKKGLKDTPKRSKDSASDIPVKPEPEVEIDELCLDDSTSDLSFSESSLKSSKKKKKKGLKETAKDVSPQKSGKNRKHFKREKGDHDVGKSSKMEEDVADGMPVKEEPRLLQDHEDADKTHKKKKHKKHIKKEHDRYMLVMQEVRQDSGSNDTMKTNNNYHPAAVKRKHSKTHLADGDNMGKAKKVKKERV